jgi:hypothetical protein
VCCAKHRGKGEKYQGLDITQVYISKRCPRHDGHRLSMSGRGRGRPRNECSPEVVGKEGEESLDPDKGSMPEKKVGSFLDLELPGTVLRRGGGMQGRAHLILKKVTWNPAEMGET